MKYQENDILKASSNTGNTNVFRVMKVAEEKDYLWGDLLKSSPVSKS